MIYGHSWCFLSSQIALACGSSNFENLKNITRAHISRNALAFIRFSYTYRHVFLLLYQYADSENLHPCLKSFQTRVFKHGRVFTSFFIGGSKPIHLTRIRCSGWVRAAWIINEFENDCAKHPSTAALIHRQQTLYWPIVNYTCIGPWWNVKRCFKAKLELAIFFFFTFLSRDPRKRVERGGKLWSLDAEYIQVYLFLLLCHGKAVNLIHLWNLEWRNVKFL